MYGVKPLAGGFQPLGDTRGVINMAAVKVLGYGSAAAAIGKMLPYQPGSDDPGRIRITAVMPDFNLYPVTHRPAPTVLTGFLDGGAVGTLLHVRLRGRDIPETLAAIDRLWRSTGQQGSIDRFFLDDFMQQRYLAMLRQAQMIAVAAGLAVLLACLGLVGIAISVAERRAKEIGIRKAMGARTAEVVALMLWRFAQPVLWANLIAWPLAFWQMQRWLSGFSDHVELQWWVFAGASVGALALALAAVAGQAWIVGRQKPVLALRYE
jgi:putative ABC transport system permease protein